MIVRELMATVPATCRADETLNRAARLMWELDCGSVPVINHDSKVIGIVTDRDICMAAYTQGRPLSEISVESVTRDRPTISCRDSADLKDAEALMTKHRVRRIAVSDADEKLVGILSFADLALECVSKSKKKGITPARVGAIAAAVSSKGETTKRPAAKK